MILGDMDPKKVEAYKVAAKPSGTWWIIGKEKSNSDTSPSSSPRLSPRLSPRPEPKRRQTTDSKPLPPTPIRRATVADVPPTPKRRGSTMSVTSVSTTPPQLDVAANQTPGGSEFFFLLTSFTCDVRHADPFPSLPFHSCHYRPERADLAPERRYRSRLLDHRASKGHDHSERSFDHRRFAPRDPSHRRWSRRSVPRLSRCPSCRCYRYRSG